MQEIFLEIPKNTARLYQRYLQCLGFSQTPACNQSTLAKLVAEHTRSLAWENIDWYIDKQQTGKPELNLANLIERYTSGQHLGGLCYQLNLSFAWLLQTIGFTITLHQATIIAFRYDLSEEPLDSHLIPIAHLDGEAIICDVGWFGLTQPMLIPHNAMSCLQPPFRIQKEQGQYCALLAWAGSDDYYQTQYKVYHKQLTQAQLTSIVDYDQAPNYRLAANKLMYMAHIKDGTLCIDQNMIHVHYNNGEHYTKVLPKKVHPTQTICELFKKFDRHLTAKV